MEQPADRPALKNTSRLDMLEKIWSRARMESREHPLVISIIKNAHSALRATAASILFLEQEDPRMIFKYASGPVGSQLKRLHIDRQSGIAGWVARNGKPMIVNDVSKSPYFNGSVDDSTGFKTKSLACVPLIINKKVTGVIEVINKLDNAPFTNEDLRVLQGISATASLAIENIKQNMDMQTSYKCTLNALVSLADAKELNAHGHSKRVAEYALIGAVELGLSKAEKQTLEYAAILHDIGKLGLPDSILNKPGSLDEEEWIKMREHPQIGYELLKGIPFLHVASRLILCHHEWFDGSGYPNGIGAEEIPLGSRLISVADAFDNMTTDHPYRAAMGHQYAFNELRKHIGSQFCPLSVQAFTAGFVKNRLSPKFFPGGIKPARKTQLQQLPL